MKNKFEIDNLDLTSMSYEEMRNTQGGIHFWNIIALIAALASLIGALKS